MNGGAIPPAGRRRGGLALVAAVVLAAPAAAEERRSGQQVYDEQLRVRLDEQMPEQQEAAFDAGGWFNFALFIYDDPAANKERTLRQFQLRGWASMNLEGIHQGYVRGLLNLDDWQHHDNPIGGRGDDFDEELERLWYRFDLGRLLEKDAGQPLPVDLEVKVGRDFATIGTALVLAMPLDLVQLHAAAWDWELTTFLGKSLEDSVNIDDSWRVAHEQDRDFFGAELAYRGFSHHRPFAYFLANWDDTQPSPRDPQQSYEYDSKYVGLGSEGALARGLTYRAEIAGEWGKMYSVGQTVGRDDIRAMVIDAALEYVFDLATHPKLLAEYIYASGDSDRATSATATVGGNQPGTDDTAFNAFGFRDTGIALAPALSNLHIYIVGATCFPLERIPACRKLELGTKVFFYQKAREAGPLSDPLATSPGRWVGWEWDVFVNWRLTSDLAWTIRYGAFAPGEAFEGTNERTREFLYTGVSLSF